MEPKEIIDKLNSLPGEIKTAKEKVDSVQKAFNEHEKMVEQKEAELMAEIFMEKNGDNKPKHTNDAMRTNALITKKADNPGYKDLAAISRKLESDLMGAKNNLDLSINTFSAVKHISELTASQLRAQDTICTHVDDRKTKKGQKK